MIAKIKSLLRTIFPTRYDREQEKMHEIDIAEESARSIGRFHQSLDDLNMAVSLLIDPDVREYRDDHTNAK